MGFGVSTSETLDKDYLKKAKKAILGSEKPSMYLRILYWISLPIFLYYVLWNGLRMIALNSIELIDNPEEFKINIQKLGEKFGMTDGVASFKLYALVMMIAFGLFFIGVILAYRKKMLGYYIIFPSLIVGFLAPIFLLSWSYFIGELDFWDYLIAPALIVAYYLPYNKKRKERDTAIEQQLP